MANIIEVKNLTKQFRDFKAVDDVSFTVRAGEVFAFLGPNGAGKTTTIKILTTLLHATSGSAVINGFDLESSKNDIRKSFGIVFQDQSLDDELTAFENMYFHAVLFDVPKKVRKEKIKKLLDFVELWDRRKDQVKKFSGGMKRRLEIARGLLHHPKIIFLDEPTLGLDPQTRNHIWEYMMDINKTEGVTVFLTTHYMDEVEKVADRVAIIDQGKIISIGTVEELKSQSGAGSLEEVFLKLTGRQIREENADATDDMRMRRAVFRK
ncbi:MAG: ATP-binding cassette domain-containing protein [Patescibacteria group bacterium]